MSSGPETVPEQFPRRPWRRSGVWVVAMMFTFAITMIAAMFVYWELYTRPFRALEMAIGARHKNSMPRAIGGKNKSHKKESHSRLRMIVHLDFDPTAGLPHPEKPNPTHENRVNLTEEMQPDPRVDQYLSSLLHLAKQHTDLSSYEYIEVYLEYRQPEKATRTLYIERKKDDWFTRYPKDLWPAQTPAAAIFSPHLHLTSNLGCMS